MTEALARAGLESSNLVVGIDFTKSNEWTGSILPLTFSCSAAYSTLDVLILFSELLTGSRSYNRRSLHHIGDGLNPYEQAISIIGKTLAAFDEDNLIPCFGFGDGTFLISLLFLLSYN